MELRQQGNRETDGASLFPCRSVSLSCSLYGRATYLPQAVANSDDVPDVSNRVLLNVLAFDGDLVTGQCVPHPAIVVACD